MSKRAPLSERPCLAVAVIVRNAESLVVETLKSVRSLADVIVVADTGSTDRTVETVRRYTPNVIQHGWADDFSAARNDCLNFIRTQWILWLDAGETIAPDDALALRRFVELEADLQKAYLLMVRITPAPGAVAAEQIGRVRLVPHSPGIQFQGRICEDIVASLVGLQIEVESLPWQIHRGAVEHDQERKFSRARRNVELANLEMTQRGAQPHLLNCLGEALYCLDERKRAADSYKQAVGSATGGSTEMLEAYYGLLTALDGEEKAVEQQLSVCLEALETFPLDMQLLCAMGGYLQFQGRLDLAARSYKTAFRHGRINLQTWHLEGIREITAQCLASACHALNDDAKAQKFLEEALQENTQSTRLREALVDLHINCGRPTEALQHAMLLPAHLAKPETLEMVVQGACLGAQGDWIQAVCPLKDAYAAGCRDPLCLRWLTTSFTSSGELYQAQEVIQEWTRLDPDNPEVIDYQDKLKQLQKQTDGVVELTPLQKPASSKDKQQVETSLGSIPAPP